MAIRIVNVSVVTRFFKLKKKNNICQDEYCNMLRVDRMALY